MGDATLILCMFAVAVAFYIGCGALFHWALIGDEMSISSAGTWGVMIAWPMALLAIYYLGMLLLAGVMAIGSAVYRIFN